MNAYRTDWFETLLGVRQGDSLSPTLFALFINDLLIELHNLDCGVKINNRNVSSLAYADDIVILSDSEEDLQCMLNCFANWCHKWQLLVNVNKSNVLHFRRKSVPQSNFVFKIKSDVLSYVPKYKYLGIIMDEHLLYNSTVEVLANSAGRALGGVISKLSMLKDLGFKTYTTLYNNCVAPIIDYCAAVRGF